MHNPPQSAARVFALCALLFACILLWHADSQLKWVGNAGFHVQPGFWSVVALAGMAVFAALALFQKTTGPGGPATELTQLQWPRFLRRWFGVAEYGLYFLIYVYLVPRLGYLPATLLVFPLLTLRVGYRSRKMVVYSWVVGLGIVLLFKSLLQVKIPGGKIYAIFPEAIRSFMTANF